MPSALPQRIQEIMDEIRRALAQVEIPSVEKLVEGMEQAESIFVYGQGRTGCMTRAFATRLMHLGMKVHCVGDTTTPPITSRDLCLVNSGTGQTRFVYHVAQAAKEAGAKLATVTAHPEARIGRMADIVVTIPAPTKGETALPDGSGQPPGSQFAQAALVLMDAIVMALMERFHLTADILAARHANIE